MDANIKFMLNVTERLALGQIQDAFSKAGIDFNQVTGVNVIGDRVAVHHASGTMMLEPSNPDTTRAVLGFICELD
jgi:hypothetical protein